MEIKFSEYHIFYLYNKKFGMADRPQHGQIEFFFEIGFGVSFLTFFRANEDALLHHITPLRARFWHRQERKKQIQF